MRCVINQWSVVKISSMTSHFVGYFDAVSSDYLSQRIEMSAQILVKGLIFCVLVKCKLVFRECDKSIH